MLSISVDTGFWEMTNTGFALEVRHIVSTSYSEGEVARRLAAIGYPYDVLVHELTEYEPSSGMAAYANGTAVTLMLNGPEGGLVRI
jgi:hypothetical protein